MCKHLLIAMGLSPASICLLPCVGFLGDVGAESATLLHVMDVHRGLEKRLVVRPARPTKGGQAW